ATTRSDRNGRSVDSSVWDFFVSHRPDWLVNVAKVLAFVGDETVLLPLTLLIMLAAFARGRRSLPAVAPFVAMLATSVVVGLAKALVGRERPPVSRQLVETASASMPSGHAAYAAALAAVVWLLAGDRSSSATVRAAALATAGAAGVARLVLGVHWLSDIIAGWLMGALVGVCVATLLRGRLQSL
ncbi:MAG: phosphatase PAP2 family protein, partial [Acidimicrobiales bacterium]